MSVINTVGAVTWVLPVTDVIIPKKLPLIDKKIKFLTNFHTYTGNLWRDYNKNAIVTAGHCYHT